MSDTVTPLPTPAPTPVTPVVNPYTSTGWTGTVAAMTTALASLGYTLNTALVPVWDGVTSRGNILALSGYRVMDAGTAQEAAVVLVRTTTGADLPTPANLTVMSPDNTNAVLGQYMGDGDALAARTISPADWFNSFTTAEMAAILIAAYSDTTPSQARAALLLGIQQANLSGVNLDSPQTIEAMTLLRDSLGIITAARYPVILRLS